MSAINYKTKKGKISDVLFFVAFGIFLISEILMTSFYAQYFSTTQIRVIRYIFVILLVVREFFIPEEYNIPTLVQLLFHNIKWLISFALVIIFIIVLKFVTSSNLMLFVMIFALCGRNLDFNRIAKISFWIILGAVAFVIISCYIGIIDNYTLINESRTRHYLGFLICLYPSMYLFILSALFLYFRGERITWLELAIMVLINVWMFLQTVSRLAFILSMLIILTFALLKVKPKFLKRKKILCGIMVLSFVICFACSLILVLMYSDSSSIMGQLNILLSHRLSALHRTLFNNGIHLFGQQLVMIGNGLDATTGEKAPGEYSYVDSFYLQFLMRNGVIFTIILLLLLTAVMYLIYRSENFPLLVCMFFIAIGLTIDDELGRLCFNPFLLLIGITILQRFMSEHNRYPKFFPGDEEGKIVTSLNCICSWRPLDNNRNYDA